MSFKLHDYQIELVNKARDELKAGNKGVLIQSPPGSGKSVVIAEIIKNATDKGSHVLFLVHRRELTEQIKKTLIQHEVNLNTVNIMTVIKAKNKLKDITPPDIIITDESHHSRASTYTAIYEHFDTAILIGFTATPWRMNGKGFTDIYDAAIYGQSVEWLIENNNLAPYKYYGVNLADDDSLKKSSTGDYTKKSIDDAIDKAIYGDVVKHYQKLAADKKAILYAHSVEASEQIAEEFNQYGIPAAHADAKTPARERNKIMNDFRSGRIQVLCNVDLISEGFDVPDCGCVIQMRPTASLVLYMQQAMRSMRYQPEKQAVIIDHVGNHTRHGLPSQEHDWGEYFEGDWKKKRKKNKAPPSKDCPHCFMVVPSNVQFCPGCEHEFETEERAGLETVDAELVEIDQNFKVDYTLVNYAKKDKDELETLDDYYLYAKAKNFKEAWIKFQVPGMKDMSWPEFYQNLQPIKQKYNY